MDRFDFLFLLPAVASGLAIAKLIQFFGELLAYQPPEMPSGLHFFWLACLFFVIVQHWYFMLDWRQDTAISSFGLYALSFLFPIGIFLMSVILCPSSQELGFKTLGSHFARNAGCFYIVAGASMIAIAIEGKYIEVGGKIGLAYPSENLARFVSGLLFISVAFLPESYRHTAAVGLLLVGVAFRLAMNRWPI